MARKQKSIKLPKVSNVNSDYVYTLDQGITQSIITTWLKCREAARYMLHCWEPVAPREALLFGSFFHWLCEVNYELIRKEQNVFEFAGLGERWMEKVGYKIATPNLAEKMLAMAEALYDPYWETWLDDDLSREWVAVEGTFDVMWNGFRLRGMRDGLFRDKKGRPWLLETKTKGQMENALEDALGLDIQNLFYITTAEQELQEKVQGVIYNCIVKPRIQLGTKTNPTIVEWSQAISTDIASQPQKYFHRFEVTYTEKQKKVFREDLENYLTEFAQWLDGKVLHYKNRTSCISRWPCEWIQACTSSSMAGYGQTAVLFGELTE